MDSEKITEQLRTITNYFGVTTEITKLSEEVGEFLGEAYKLAYNNDTKKDIEGLTDETADVFVVLIQILLHFDIDIDTVFKIMQQKIDRTIDRIDKDWYKNHR